MHEALGIDSIDALEAGGARRPPRQAAALRPQDRGEDPQGHRAAPRARARSACTRRRAEEASALLRHGARASGRRSRPSSPARSAGVARRWATSTSSPRAGATPAAVAASFARRAGRRSARRRRASAPSRSLRRRHCARPPLRRARRLRASRSGARPASTDHVDAVAARLAERGFALDGDAVARRTRRAVVPIADEARCTQLAGLAFVPPELREGLGEIEPAATGRVPTLVEAGDIRGVLHCHSHVLRRQGDHRRDGRRGARHAAGATSGSPTTRSPRSTPAACRASACSRSTTRSTR